MLMVATLALAVAPAAAQPRQSAPSRPAPGPNIAPSGHQDQAVDLNEGASPAQIFSGACAVCHQGGGGGLAKGRSAGQLAGFLRQHYTTGQQQAGALAAYLTSGGLDQRPSRTQPARAEPIDRPPAAIGSRRPSWDSEDDDPALDALPADRRRKPPTTEAARPPERIPNEKRRPADASKQGATSRAQAPGQGPGRPAAPAVETPAPPPEPVAAPPPVEQKPAVPEIPL